MATYVIGEEKWGRAKAFPYKVSGAAGAVFSDDEIIICGGNTKQNLQRIDNGITWLLSHAATGMSRSAE